MLVVVTYDIWQCCWLWFIKSKRAEKEMYKRCMFLFSSWTKSWIRSKTALRYVSVYCKSQERKKRPCHQRSSWLSSQLSQGEIPECLIFLFIYHVCATLTFYSLPPLFRLKIYERRRNMSEPFFFIMPRSFWLRRVLVKYPALQKRLPCKNTQTQVHVMWLGVKMQLVHKKLP